MRWCVMVMALALWVSVPAYGQLTFYESEDGDYNFTLGGYARTFGGIQHLRFDTLGLVPDVSGVNANILRLEWGSNLGPKVTLNVHNRFALNVQSGSGGLGAQAFGVGVSAAPDRFLDTQSLILDEEGLRFEHDLDRFAVNLYLDELDLYIGRQAISWGNANLFTVADLWAPFSPFDLDNSQKRGIDAIRVLFAANDEGDIEIDMILADRGAAVPGEEASLENLSGGMRTVFYLESSDVYVAAAKIWNEVMVMGGIAWSPVFESVPDLALTFRAELVAPWRFDSSTPELPRATAGLDYLSQDLFISFEYHFNGTGVTNASEYVEHATTSEEVARGESYFLGQHYLGLAANYRVTEYFSLGGSVVFNPADPSVLIATVINYSVSENVDLGLGTYSGIGAEPDLSNLLEPRLGSEFGAAGDLFFLQLAAFF